MTSGFDEILANITKLQVNNRRQARKAVSDAAELFAEALKENTPKDEGDMAEDVVISGFKGGSQAEIEKDIGYGKATGYRVKYPDDGTINQSPQNFKEKTINEMTPKIQKLYAERIKEGLKL